MTSEKIKESGGIEHLTLPAYSSDLELSDYQLFRTIANYIQERQADCLLDFYKINKILQKNYKNLAPALSLLSLLFGLEFWQI